MPTVAYNGREMTIEFDGTIIKGVQSKTAAITRAAVDVTSDDDSGYQTLLAEPGVISAEWSCEGVTGDEIFVAACLTGTYALTECTLNLPTGGTIVQDFFISAYELSGETDGAYTFTCTLQSSGAPAYTPAA